MKIFLTLSLIWLLSLAASHPAQARTIMLNGTDISSARNQVLENVTLRIDALGNVFIEAPHYSVHEENTFLPLGTQTPGAQSSRHKKPGMISSELNKTQGQMLPKAEQLGTDTKDAVRDPKTPAASGSGADKLAPKEGEKAPTTP